MSKFRKKPVVIEAEQWFPPGDDRHKPIEGVRRGAYTLQTYDSDQYYVEMMQGQTARVVEGDWIITEPDGVHHFPCSAEEFAQRYEPA